MMFMMYMYMMATCLNKNDGVKMAQRWCRGSKNSKYKKSFKPKHSI